MANIVELNRDESGLVSGGDPEGGSNTIPPCIPMLPGEDIVGDIMRRLSQVGN